MITSTKLQEQYLDLVGLDKYRRVEYLVLGEYDSKEGLADLGEAVRVFYRHYQAGSTLWSKAWDDNARFGVQSQRTTAMEAANTYWQKAIDDLKAVA